MTASLPRKPELEEEALGGEVNQELYVIDREDEELVEDDGFEYDEFAESPVGSLM